MMSLLSPGTLDSTIALYLSLALSEGRAISVIGPGSIYFSPSSPKGRSISVIVLGFNSRGKPVECGLCHNILIITPGLVSLQKHCLVGLYNDCFFRWGWGRELLLISLEEIFFSNVFAVDFNSGNMLKWLTFYQYYTKMAPLEVNSPCKYTRKHNFNV